MNGLYVAIIEIIRSEIYAPIITSLLASMLGLWLFPIIVSIIISSRINIVIPRFISPYDNVISFRITYRGDFLEYMGVKMTSSIEKLNNEMELKNESLIFSGSYIAKMKFNDSLECISTIKSFQNRGNRHNTKSIILFRYSKIFNLIITKDITKKINEISWSQNIRDYNAQIKIESHNLWNKHGRNNGTDQRDWYEAETKIRNILCRNNTN